MYYIRPYPYWRGFRSTFRWLNDNRNIISSMPLKLIRLSGSLADESFPVIVYFMYFSRTGNCTGPMSRIRRWNSFRSKSSQVFSADCFQVKEIQISPIVFQIVAGSFHNILIDSAAVEALLMPNAFRKTAVGCISPCNECRYRSGVNAQIHTPV